MKHGRSLRRVAMTGRCTCPSCCRRPEDVDRRREKRKERQQWKREVRT